MEPRTSATDAAPEFDPTTLEAMPSPEVTRLTLLRHGAVESPGERIVRGQLDVGLTAEGERQHEHLAAFVAQRGAAPVDRIVTSDLTRCTRLAELVARDAGIAAERAAAFREQDMGAWQGRTWSSVQREEGQAINDYWDDYVNARPPAGESLQQLSDRVNAAWDELFAAGAGGHVVLVTHVGVIRCLLCRFMGVPLDQSLRWAPAVGSFTQLLLSEAGAVLSSFGERPWALQPNADEAE